ncbi:MAG TPA: prepilin peptidase [Isosphaeraceae bacterium]|nr:prepilin peptidase [Isosphaeraceae bacterium]
MISTLHLILAAGTFVYGSVIGSFLNVCIYRIPWEKSVVWPESRCPRCLAPIRKGDNVPILGWILLRGRCRNCALPISARYPAIEALTGLLCVAVYLVDVVLDPHSFWMPTEVFPRVLYHQILISLLIVATFIDYDHYLIPDAVTVTGMVLGIGLAAIFPEVRPEPASATTAFGALLPPLEAAPAGFAIGFLVQAVLDLALLRRPGRLGLGLFGAFVGWQAALRTGTAPWGSVVVGVECLLIGGAIVWAIRVVGSILLRKEAMGFGDVTLMAMIGSFVGWQPLPMVLFLGAMLGLVHALLRFFAIVLRWLRGGKFGGALRPIPFGPYLSLAAIVLLLGWPWIWTKWAAGYYRTVGVVSSEMWTLGMELWTGRGRLR